MAVLQLSSVPQTASAQVIKSVVISSVFFLLMIGLLFFLSASGFLILTAFLLGIVATVILSITGSLKLVADDILSNVSELLKGLLPLLNNLYAYYRKSSTEEIAREQFVTKFLREFFIPKLLKKIPASPVKKRIEKAIVKLVEQVGNSAVKRASGKTNKLLEEPKQAGLSIASKVGLEDETFVQSMTSAVDKRATVLKKQCSAPFFKTLKVASIFWVIIWLVHFM